MRSIFALATASLATLAFLAFLARGDTADTLERTFTVSPGGSLRVDVDFGAVEVTGGSIHATLLQPVPGPVRLVTSGGGVTLKVAPDSAFELDAATSGGNCRSEIELSRRTSNPKDAASLRGVFGDGGPKVFLRSSGGGIRVVQAEKIPRLN